MTKMYEGGGIYTLHLTSGKTLELTEDELKEIAEESPAYQELQEEYDTDMYNSIIKDIEDALSELDSLGKYI